MPRFVHAHTDLPDLPAEVLDEVDAAWERAHELVAGELELHFEVSVSGLCAASCEPPAMVRSSRACPLPRRWRSPAVTRSWRSPHSCATRRAGCMPVCHRYRRS